jgi:hypothetical protein
MPHKDPEVRKAYMKQYGKKWYEANKEDKHAKRMKRRAKDPHKMWKDALARFGLTVDQFIQKLEYQDGVCAICHRPETRVARSGNVVRLSVDHNHETGEVRDLLCHYCNAAFGMLREDPTIIANMLAYARKWQALESKI